MTHGHGWRSVLGGQDVHAQCRLATGAGVTHSSVSVLMLRNTGPRNCAVVWAVLACLRDEVAVVV